MRLIRSNFEILEQEPGIQGIYKQIERAGRLSYKSEDKITEDSAENFVNMLIKRGHTSCLEHGTVYLYIDSDWDNYMDYLLFYSDNPYSVVNRIINSHTLEGSVESLYITTNSRVLYENNRLKDLQNVCDPKAHHEKRISVKFTLPISISREFIRHRVFSFMEMSTRYCNYNADKFNNELTFIVPYWSSLKEARYVYWDGDYVEDTTPESLPHKILKHVVGDEDDMFLSVCEQSELTYKFLINKGMRAQEAREILPLCTKTELIMTGTIEQWKGFFKLRCDKAAHPQAQELAISLKEEFIKKNLLDGND